MTPAARGGLPFLAFATRRFVFGLLVVYLCVMTIGYANGEKRLFDIPSGSAQVTLKTVALQGQIEIFYTDQTVEGVQTPSVQGKISPREALKRLVSGTGLEVVQDSVSGAYAILKPEKKVSKADTYSIETSTVLTRQPLQQTEMINPVENNNSLKPKNPILRIAGVIMTAILTTPQTGVAQESSADEELFELSPFEVSTTDDIGYYASSSMAGTRTNTQLRDIASSIQVVTEEFMEDIGATGLDSLLQYTTSSETAGIQGNFVGFTTPGNEGTSSGDSRAQIGNFQRIRGLGNPDKTRNFYQTLIPFDSYNTSRIDINRGANSFLFGLGSPAGLVNENLNKAEFNDRVEISFRIGEGGNDPSTRFTLDYNKQVSDLLAVRFATLYNDTNYRQRPTFYNDKRIYGALSYRPFENTTIRAHYENGQIDANPPDVLLPIENLSTFLDAPTIQRISIDALENVRQTGSPEGQYNRIPTNNALTSASPPQAYQIIWDGTTTNGSPSYARVGGIRGNNPRFKTPHPYFNTEGTNRRPWMYYPYHGNFRDLKGSGYVQRGFLDLETFDFSKYNLAGNNDKVTRDFSNFNYSLEHIALNGKVGLELAFDHQEIESEDWIVFRANSETIIFDINKTLFYPDPSGDGLTPLPNPNYGRPFIMTQSWDTKSRNDQDTFRFTGFIKHDFKDNINGWLGKVIGRHRLTALVDKIETESRVIGYKYASFTDPEVPDDLSTNNSNATTRFDRSAFRYIYIGPPQLNAFTDPSFSLKDFQLEPIYVDLNLPEGYSTPVTYWNVQDNNWDQTNLSPQWVPSNNHSIGDRSVTSVAFNLQSHVLNDLVVLNMGWREDKVKERKRVNDAPLVDEVIQVDSESWNLNDTLELVIQQDVFNYGLVVNWPHQIVKLPDWLDATAHYNESENFSPESSQVDLYGRLLPLPTGTSRDYGFSLYLFDEKLVARLNWFEGALKNSGTYYSEVNNTVTRTIRHLGNLTVDILEVDADQNGIIDPEANDSGNRSQELLDLAYEARDYLDPLIGEDIRQHFFFNPDPVDGSFDVQWAGTDTTDKHDNETTGFEMEIIANPTPNWRIALNISRSETSLTNIVPRLTEFVETVVQPYVDRYGSLGYSSPTRNDVSTVETELQDLTLYNFYALKASEGSPSNEQRKWNWNLISSYGFQEGLLEGFLIGGAYRWQDRFALGYPVIQRYGTDIPDINNPYWSETESSLDLWLSYSTKVFKDARWKIQVNVRNADNWNSDSVSILRVQPDGEPARARFDPPREIFITNTITF